MMTSLSLNLKQRLIQLKWNGNVATVAASFSQVDVAGYYYTYDSSEQPTAATILAANSIENPSESVSFTLSDLKYDTNYTVYIAGHNNTTQTFTRLGKWLPVLHIPLNNTEIVFLVV